MEDTLNKLTNIVAFINDDLDNRPAKINMLKKKKADLEEGIKKITHQNSQFISQQNQLMTHKTNYEKKSNEVSALDNIILKYQKQNKAYTGQNPMDKKLLKTCHKHKQTSKEYSEISGIYWNFETLEKKRAGVITNSATGNKKYFEMPVTDNDLSNQINHYLLELANPSWKQLINFNE